jgi:hypothetical protein
MDFLTLLPNGLIDEFLITGKVKSLDDFNEFKNSELFGEYEEFKLFLEFKKQKSNHF